MQKLPLMPRSQLVGDPLTSAAQRLIGAGCGSDQEGWREGMQKLADRAGQLDSMSALLLATRRMLAASMMGQTLSSRRGQLCAPTLHQWRSNWLEHLLEGTRQHRQRIDRRLPEQKVRHEMKLLGPDCFKQAGLQAQMQVAAFSWRRKVGLKLLWHARGGHLGGSLGACLQCWRESWGSEALVGKCSSRVDRLVLVARLAQSWLMRPSRLVNVLFAWRGQTAAAHREHCPIHRANAIRFQLGVYS